MPPPPPMHGAPSGLSLALDLAVAKFFLANPSATEVRWESVRSTVMELAAIDELPGSFLSGVEGKVFHRPEQQPHEGSSSPKASPESPPGFGVTLTPETQKTHRGASVKFTASTIELGDDADFHFVALPVSPEPGVDEVPAMDGDPSSSPVFETSFDQVGRHQVVVRGYAPDGRTARTFAQVEVTNRPPEVSVEGVPSAVHRGQPITPQLKVSDPDGDATVVAVSAADGTPLAEGEKPEFALGALGESSFEVRVTDSLGAVVEVPVSITVTNRPPSIGIASRETKTHPGQGVDIEATWDDPDGDAATLKAFVGDREVEQPSPGVFRLTIHEPGRHEVRIEALDEHGSRSSSTAVVEVENRPPQIALLPDPPTGHRGSPIKLVESISDPDGDQVTARTVVMGEERTWDDGEEITAAFSSLGPQEVEVIAEDARGARASERFVVLVVNAPPVVSLSISPDEVHRGTEVKVIANASDPESEGLLYKFEGEGVSSSASTSQETTLTPSKLGTVSVSVVVSDPHGAVAQAEKSFEVRPRPPEVSLQPSSPTASRLDDFSVSVDHRCPETGESPRSVEIEEPSAWRRTETGFAGKFKTLGEQRIRVSVESTTGAKSTAETMVTVTNLPPQIEVLVPDAPHHRVRPARFAVKYEDPDGPSSPSSVEWQVDGGTVVSKDGDTAVIEYSRLGETLVRATVADSDGGSASAEAKLLVENVPPSITVSPPNGPFHRTRPVEIKVEAFDIDGQGASPSVEVSMDGQVIQPNDGIYQITPSRLGAHEIKVVASDADGARSEETLSVDVENSPPTVELSVPSDPWEPGKEITLSAVGSDLEGGEVLYEFEASGVRFPPSPSSEAKLTFTKPGKHPVSVTAIDSDGARTSAKGEVKVK